MFIADYSSYVNAFGWFFTGVVIREVPKVVLEKVFMKQPTKGTLPNGNGLASATRRDVREVFDETLKAEVTPMLSQQTKILEAIAETNARMSEGITKLVTLEEYRGRRK
jgi:hypothetical protein